MLISDLLFMNIIFHVIPKLYNASTTQPFPKQKQDCAWLSEWRNKQMNEFRRVKAVEEAYFTDAAVSQVVQSKSYYTPIS